MSERSFEEMLSDHLDGVLNVDEQQRFAEMLRDPALAKRFVVSCQMHAMLAWEHGAMPALEDQVARPRERTHRLRWLLGIAVAAALVLLAAVSFVAMHPAAAPVVWQDRPPAGTLAKSCGGRLSVPELDMELHEGDELRVGDYLLAAGFVQMDLDGVELTVESPAHFQVVSKERVLLETGRLSARVPKGRKGFQIEAGDMATAEILSGAETAIEADSEASEIHVFEGEVEVLPKNQELPVHLTRSKATRIGRTGPPAGVDVDGDRFVRSLEEPAADYAAIVRSLEPVVYFRMGSQPDGVTLPNDAQQPRRVDDVGRVYVGQMKRPPFAPGRIGTALRLQGPEAGAYAVYPQYPLATESLTVCAWVKARSRPRWATIAKHSTMNVGQFQWGLHGDDGDLEIQVFNAAGEQVSIRERAPIPLASWQFVAFVFDGSNLRLYRDGLEIGSAACEGLDLRGASDLGIGVKLGRDAKPAAHHTGFWDGRIDELAIFHRALSASEIELLYESGMPPAPKVASGPQQLGRPGAIGSYLPVAPSSWRVADSHPWMKRGKLARYLSTPRAVCLLSTLEFEACHPQESGDDVAS